MVDWKHELDGWIIADKRRPEQKKRGWWVLADPYIPHSPLQLVTYGDDDGYSCECDDFGGPDHWCPHLWAVHITLTWEIAEQNPDDVFRIVTLDDRRYLDHHGKPRRPPGKRNWTAYNEAKANEVPEFRSLLFRLTRGLHTPPSGDKGGKPRNAVSLMVFTIAMMVYHNTTQRNVGGFLEQPLKDGLIEKIPSFGSISEFLNSEETTDILHDVIARSTIPFDDLETEFSVDWTGQTFTFAEMIEEMDETLGRPVTKRDYKKLHVISGVKSKVVFAAIVTGREEGTGGAQVFPKMFEGVVARAKVETVLGDREYWTKRMASLAGTAGAKAFLRPKKYETLGPGDKFWVELNEFASLNKRDFFHYYYLRNNTETVFSGITKRWKDFVRSQGDRAMTNEILCKVICWNLVRLIHDMYESGLKPDFEKRTELADDSA